MRLQKRHKLELLVNLAAADMIDWQSCLVLRPRSRSPMKCRGWIVGGYRAILEPSSTGRAI
jgi:hypothetical protein